MAKTPPRLLFTKCVFYMVISIRLRPLTPSASVCSITEATRQPRILPLTPTLSRATSRASSKASSHSVASILGVATAGSDSSGELCNELCTVCATVCEKERGHTNSHRCKHHLFIEGVPDLADPHLDSDLLATAVECAPVYAKALNGFEAFLLSKYPGTVIDELVDDIELFNAAGTGAWH